MNKDNDNLTKIGIKDSNMISSLDKTKDKLVENKAKEEQKIEEKTIVTDFFKRLDKKYNK